MTSAFRITSWDENPYAEFEGAGRLTVAITTQNYSGDLAGTGSSRMLMYYGAESAPVHYTGLEHFSGTVHGRSGTFVMQAKGTFAAGVADTTWSVVPGSGTGSLAGLSGAGSAKAVGGESSVPVTFDCHFAE